MYTDKEIINGLTINDRTIINHIYKKQYPVIMGWIKNNSGSADDTDDIFQEAFLIVIRKLKSESLSLNSSFSTYLFSICKHLWLQELRKRSKLKVKEVQDFHDIEDTFCEENLEERKLQIYLKILNSLESKCRQLLLLYCKKKSLQEMMEIMGFKNLQAVADKKKNCRKTLIKNLLNCKEYKELQREIYIDN